MLQSPPKNVYTSIESSALVTFITGIGVTYLSLCLVLPTMVVSIFASHFLLTIFLLPLINEPTIGWFSIDLVLGTILVGWLVGVVQAFVLQHVLHVSLRSWNMWIICTTMGWSSALISAGIAFLPLSWQLHQMLSAPLVSLIQGSLMGVGGGLIVGFMQWLILRQTTRHARYWVLATILAWMSGWALFWSMVDRLFSNWSIS